MLETFDAVRKLILSNRHVTYREIEITIKISGTSINSIFHQYLIVKRFIHLDPTQFVNRAKKGSCRMSSKVNSSRLDGCFKMSRIIHLMSHPLYSRDLATNDFF